MFFPSKSYCPGLPFHILNFIYNDFVRLRIHTIPIPRFMCYFNFFPVSQSRSHIDESVMFSLCEFYNITVFHEIYYGNVNFFKTFFL